MDARITLAALVAVAALGAAGRGTTRPPVPPSPACPGGRCVWPVKEARAMTTQPVKPAREIAAALSAVAAKATAKATFALG